MRIGFIIGRVGGVDGVALEAEKWVTVLRRMGHKTFVLSGDIEGRPLNPEEDDLLRPLSFYGNECNWEQKQAYFGGPASTDELLDGIQRNARVISDGIVQWARRRALDLVVVENAGALPFHISMGLGVRMALEQLGLPAVTHDHDFAWERGDRYLSPREELNALVGENFPLRLANVHHAVINTPARESLATRFGIEAAVVPNVMDFNRPYGLKNDFNTTLPTDIGLGADDIPLFQVTRIIERKGIDTAVRLVSMLGDQRVKLVITGAPTDDPGGRYMRDLKDLIASLRLESRVRFGFRSVAREAGITAGGNKLYGLSDAYAHARACTFFSIYEGFGNAFVECVLAKKPIFVNNYKPVYMPDIGSQGFQAVMLEDNVLTDEAVAEIDGIVHDEARCREIGEYNFQLGRLHFSYEVLELRLAALLHKVVG